jgi:hypothetical protein
MKPYKFKIADCFAEEMKRKLDRTEFEYTATPGENSLTDFEVEILTPDDKYVVKELEMLIF